MNPDNESKKRVLGELGGFARQLKADALRKKYAPAEEEEDASETDAPMEPGAEGVPGDDEAVEAAKEALAALDDAQVQELLATLKK